MLQPQCILAPTKPEWRTRKLALDYSLVEKGDLREQNSTPGEYARLSFQKSVPCSSFAS